MVDFLQNNVGSVMLLMVAVLLLLAVAGIWLFRTFRRDAGARFAALEAHFRDIFENAPEGIVVLEARSCQVLSANPFIERMLGYTHEEMLALTLDDFFDSAYGDLQASFDKLVERSSAHLGDHRYRRQDGSFLDVDITAAKIRFLEGECILVFARDVAKRRRAENERAALQRLSRRLTEQLNERLIARAVASECRIVLRHDAFLFRLYDQTRKVIDEIYAEDTPVSADAPVEMHGEFGLPVGQLSHSILDGGSVLLNRREEDMENFGPPFGDTTRQSRSLMFVPVRWKHETYGIISVQSYANDRYGESDLNLLQTFADHCGGALARVAAEKRLHEITSVQRAVLDAAPYAIISTDSKGIIRTFNAGAEKMFGYKATEVVGKITQAILHDPVELEAIAAEISAGVEKDYKSGIDALIAKVSAEGIQQRECLMARVDGSRFPSLISFNALKGADDSFEGMVGIVIDITQQRQSNEMLAQRERLLEALVEVQRNLFTYTTNQNLYEIELPILGRASDASRVYVFENHVDQDGRLMMSQSAEWCAEGVPSEMDNALLQNLPYDELPPKLRTDLESGGFVNELVAGMPGSIRQLLEAQGVRAILLLPLTFKDRFAGFIGFDNCVSERLWNDSEVNLLRAAASSISLARERRDAEEKLLSTTSELRAIFNVFPDIFFRLSADGVFLDCRTGSTRDLFASPESFMNKPVRDVMPAQAAEDIMQGIDRTMSMRSIVVIEYTIPIGGVDQDFEARMVPFRNDEVIALVRNVTEQKQAQRQISLQASALEAAANGIAIIARDGRIRWINPALTRMTGFTLGEAIGKNPRIFKSGKHDRDFYRNIWDTVMSGRVWHGELINRRKNGSHYYEEMTITPVLDEDGAVSHFIAIKQDVSQRKVAEEELLRAKLAAETADRAKSDFLANMSHEIRTPMNGVIGMTEMLADTILTPEQCDYIETIRSSGEALLAIINDILDFSKIEAGKLELEQIEFDLRATIEEVANILRPKAREKGLELHSLVLHDVSTRLKGDPVRMRQILLNLANNAVKFTNHGEILIQVGSQSKSDGNITLHFTVRDTGIGIPPERMDRLFKPFSQIDASTTRKFGGTGLGLAICSQLVGLMGGRIWVESVVGKGSAFHFTADFELISSPDGTGVRKRMLGVRALIMGQNPMTRRVLVENLKLCGCAGDEAETTAQAASDLRATGGASFGYDVVIVDGTTPGIDSTAILEELRAASPRDAKFVLLTPQPEIGWIDSQTVAGYDACFHKPVRQMQMREAIEVALGRIVLEKPAAVDIEKPAMPDLRLDARILLVEDNTVNQRVASLMLKRAGFDCDVAMNGAEAVDRHFRSAYDLIFMDCQMPILDGYQATRRIRDREAQTPRHTPIVAMTAHAMEGDRERCIASGMDDYISKPIDAQALNAILVRFLAVMPPGGDADGLPQVIPSNMTICISNDTEAGTDTPASRQVSCLPDAPEARVQMELDPVDLDFLAVNTDNDPDIERDLIEIFIETTAKSAGQIRDAIAAGDNDTVRRQSHSIKGAAANMGARKLSLVTADLERRARDGDNLYLNEVCADLDAEFARVSEFLARRLADIK